jgi:hypothetical protein
MDKRMLTMILVLVGLLVGGALGAAVFFAKAQTQQHLDALPWWAGIAAGFVAAIVISVPGVWIIRRRRRRGAT